MLRMALASVGTPATRTPISWNRIIQTPMIERLAAPNALDGQPPTAPQAIALDGVIPIVRTGWLESTTGRKHF
jgi:hypothetical protein